MKTSIPESEKPDAGHIGPFKALSHPQSRHYFPSVKPRRQQRASPPSYSPLFNAIWRARNLHELHVALGALVPKLLRRGQDAADIASDLSQLAQQARGPHLHTAVAWMTNDLALDWARRRAA